MGLPASLPPTRSYRSSFKAKSFGQWPPSTKPGRIRLIPKMKSASKQKVELAEFPPTVAPASRLGAAHSNGAKGGSLPSDAARHVLARGCGALARTCLGLQTMAGHATVALQRCSFLFRTPRGTRATRPRNRDKTRRTMINRTKSIFVMFYKLQQSHPGERRRRGETDGASVRAGGDVPVHPLRGMRLGGAW